MTALAKAVRDYDTLVRDPCAGPFATPPYAGAASGYFTRIQVAIPITASTSGTAGTDTFISFAMQIQPAAFPVIYYTAAGFNSVSPVWIANTLGGSFLQNTAVKAYRPVAACAKFVSNGPIAKRAGLIAVGYTQGPVRAVGQSGTGPDILQFSQDGLERCPNGSGAHEIRFLPCPGDEQYHQTPTNLFAEGGTLNVSGTNVDAIQGSATTATANGYVEFTGVYEWVPEGSAGISTAPTPTVGFTSQDYQSTIGDMGAFLLHGVRTAARVVGGQMVRGAAETVMQSISGISSRRVYGVGAPMLTY